MFRSYYAELGMEDPRDSWYKPNLLYNIHYRPPTPSAPTKVKVVTKKFNPSFCTCGEHSCGPRYRMEKEVVMLDKEKEKEENTKLFVRGKDGASDIEEADDDVNDIAEPCEAELTVGDAEVPDDDDDFGSYFGIMSVYVDSGLHTAWAGKNEVKAC